MKVHIKAVTLLIVGILVINCLSFGIPVFAAAVSPSPGVSSPFELWPQGTKDPFLEGVYQFLYDITGYSSQSDNIHSYYDYETTRLQIEYAILNYVNGVVDETNGTVEDISFDYDPNSVENVLVQIEAIPQMVLNEWISVVNASTYVGLGKHVDGMYISFSAYEQGINNILNNIIAEDDHSSIAWDMKHINGVPQNEITINQDYVVSVFDFLGLDYKMFTSPNNLVITTDVFDNTHLSTLYYTPFFITENNDLYILYKTVYQEYFNSKYSGVGGQNRFYLGSEYYSTSFDWEKTIKGYLSFRFFAQDTSLYLGVLSCYSSSQDKNNVHWNQYIISDPEISYTPILFDDRSSLVAQSSPYEKVVSLKTENQSVEFFKASDGSHSTKFDYSYILDEGIAYCGYFYGDKSIVGYEYSNIQSAGQMLLGTENAISGGGQTITSGLTDWQKAIYILAQQQGTTYEELLEKLDMIIDAQGNITISGADGIQYSVNELSKSFDEIYSKVENISGDLSELLEYLKSLNIEGLESYIAALEGTLNDLNERDKDQTVILGGISGTLTDLKSQLESLNLSGISSGVSSIDQTLSRIEAREQSLSDFNAQFTSMGIYGGMTFHLYDQCKYFLDNLFNYNDRNTPPNFSFYYDSNGDGVTETYPLIDFSFLETTLTNENTVDKSLWSTPIKIIDLIRYIIAIVCYGLFVMRLIKRLPTFYGNGPLSLSG